MKQTKDILAINRVRKALESLSMSDKMSVLGFVSNALYAEAQEIEKARYAEKANCADARIGVGTAAQGSFIPSEAKSEAVNELAGVAVQ